MLKMRDQGLSWRLEMAWLAHWPLLSARRTAASGILQKGVLFHLCTALMDKVDITERP